MTPYEELKFEEAVDLLEKVVRQLESGEVSLEDALELFERGVILARICNQRLDDAEAKIEVLLERNGDIESEPFAKETEDSRE